ncbi:MAG: hypothetical protein R3F56_00200 [Planctomycetota bacterium]
MNRTFSFVFFSIAFGAVPTLANGQVPAADGHGPHSFVVANRGSHDLTVHDAWDGSLRRTVPLPAAAQPAEPMYVVQVRDEVVVGDRANDRVVRFGKRDFAVRGEVAVGRGVFHMWSNGRELWVNNDVDATTSVVDTHSWAVVHTIAMPADLVGMGYKPHDVFVGARDAWVSLVAGSGSSDWVIRYDVGSHTEQGRAAVARDPHLWWDRASDRLFVASQEGEIAVFDGSTLRRRQTVTQAGAHGIYVPSGTNTLLVTNLPGMGADDPRRLPHLAVRLASGRRGLDSGADGAQHRRPAAGPARRRDALGCDRAQGDAVSAARLLVVDPTGAHRRGRRGSQPVRVGVGALSGATRAGRLWRA